MDIVASFLGTITWLLVSLLFSPFNDATAHLLAILMGCLIFIKFREKPELTFINNFFILPIFTFFLVQTLFWINFIATKPSLNDIVTYIIKLGSLSSTPVETLLLWFFTYMSILTLSFLARESPPSFIGVDKPHFILLICIILSYFGSQVTNSVTATIVFNIVIYTAFIPLISHKDYIRSIKLLFLTIVVFFGIIYTISPEKILIAFYSLFTPIIIFSPILITNIARDSMFGELNYVFHSINESKTSIYFPLVIFILLSFLIGINILIFFYETNIACMKYFNSEEIINDWVNAHTNTIKHEMALQLSQHDLSPIHCFQNKKNTLDIVIINPTSKAAPIRLFNKENSDYYVNTLGPYESELISIKEYSQEISYSLNGITIGHCKNTVSGQNNYFSREYIEKNPRVVMNSLGAQLMKEDLEKIEQLEGSACSEELQNALMDRIRQNYPSHFLKGKKSIWTTRFNKNALEKEYLERTEIIGNMFVHLPIPYEIESLCENGNVTYDTCLILNQDVLKKYAHVFPFYYESIDKTKSDKILLLQLQNEFSAAEKRNDYVRALIFQQALLNYIKMNNNEFNTFISLSLIDSIKKSFVKSSKNNTNFNPFKLVMLKYYINLLSTHFPTHITEEGTHSPILLSIKAQSTQIEDKIDYIKDKRDYLAFISELNEFISQTLCIENIINKEILSCHQSKQDCFEKKIIPFIEENCI